MVRLVDLPAGDFIGLDKYYKELLEEVTEPTALAFFELLKVAPQTEEEVLEVFKEFANQLLEIKETYIWIYNPPQVIPSSITEQPKNTHLIKEFEEDYSGYIELIYLLCNGNMLKFGDVMQMKTKDFLFWSEYLLRKRIIEMAR